jgi:RimJ/RimL family protein N-acetyltransferase
MKRDQMDHPDFGFALLPLYHRHGYALEASKGYLYHLFSTHPKLTVAAICKRENNPSIQLLEKIGFTFNCIMDKDKEPLNLYLLKKEDLIVLQL